MFFKFFTNRVMMPVTQCINTVQLKWRRNTAVWSHWALREAEMRWLAFYSEVKYALISLNLSQQETLSLIWPLGEMSAYDKIELSHIYKQKKEKANSLFIYIELVSGDFKVLLFSLGVVKMQMQNVLKFLHCSCWVFFVNAGASYKLGFMGRWLIVTT